MGQLKNFITPLHEGTKRDYLFRMQDDKVHCMNVASEYEYDYWDGNRRYGYGGYRFIEGRWTPVAQSLITNYGLSDSSSILDIGCGKGYLIHEIKTLLPGCRVLGLDISRHGLDSATPLVKDHVTYHDARLELPFHDNEFDLAISLGAFHNFRLMELKVALSEIQRVGKNGYLMIESYNNTEELFNLQCWALTAKSFLDPDEWIWLFDEFGYLGDYEFIYFK
jgi:SAM-dependent methyltransferase